MFGMMYSSISEMVFRKLMQLVAYHFTGHMYFFRHTSTTSAFMEKAILITDIS